MRREAAIGQPHAETAEHGAAPSPGLPKRPSAAAIRAADLRRAAPAFSATPRFERAATRPPPRAEAGDIRIDIGRIDVTMPRAPAAPRRRPEPPPLTGKRRGGPEA